MRICHVAPELLPVPPSRGGAIERWVRDCAARLAQRGHEVHVVARDHGDGITTREIDGVHYHFVRIPAPLERGRLAALFRGLWYYTKVRNHLVRIRPEIVHHHSRPAGLWRCRTAAPGARQVISLHSMEYGWGFGYRGWDRRWYRAGLTAATRVLCVSDFIRQHTLERYPNLAETAETLYNGVDGVTFHPAASPRDEGLALRILYVGRVEARKGVHVLLDAFEQVIAPARPDVELAIVGPHSYWDAQPSGYYDTVAARCARNPSITLHPPTYVDAELAAIYRSADVSVVPSVFPEALGLTSIEAQASGVPVVVSNAGGLPETVLAGKSGLVFENEDAGDLGRSLLALLADAPRRRAMAADAAAWAMAMFSWDVIAAQIEGVYVKALVTPSAGAAP